MEAAGGLPGDADRPGSCGACGWSGTALRQGRSDDDAGADDPSIPACPRCGAIVLPDLPSVDEIRAARQQAEP